MHTPWGQSQHQETLAEGIIFVSTASHGGAKLDRKRNALIPAPLRKPGGWYEEDCEIAIPIVFFPTAFPKSDQGSAHQSIKDYEPDAYEQVFGVKLGPEDSYKRRQEQFDRETFNRYVTRSAFGSWNQTVPDGFVGVVAWRASDDSTVFRLVDEATYKNRARDKDWWCGYVLTGDEPEWSGPY